MAADARATEQKTYWEAATETAWGCYLSDAEQRVLLQALALAPEGDAMDLGCEGGRWSRHLVARGGSTICVDVDPATLELCGRRLPEATCVLVDRGDQVIPADDGQLALLLIYEVAPVTNAAWLPAEAARVLRPDGILVFSDYNPASIRAIVRRGAAVLDARRRSGEFYRGPTYRRLRTTLTCHGLESIYEEGLARAPFTRISHSRLIPVCIHLQGALGLRRLVTASPWVLAIARRRASPHDALTSGSVRQG